MKTYIALAVLLSVVTEALTQVSTRKFEQVPLTSLGNTTFDWQMF